ncbi:hypothetical protein DDZ13_08960 [Coraliomargarita sinensis]|uniref:Uncharacterized protein n=2 Tax=Coraliomargarita sinensis TaxID=2174842 RepID=A0A317ZK24_9BACT|nr:hypothetical protein DDZ13_08960 [Coraliomargarita sinensis]
MITGTKKSSLSPSQVIDRLAIAMAGGNFEIQKRENERIDFRHGTYLTQTATMMPKRGKITVQPDGDGSRVCFEIEVYGFAKYWLIFFAVIFCWMIFPPVVVYRALCYHPGKLMQNLLQTV